MPNQRSKDKALVTFWATPEEKAALAAASEQAGFQTIADYIRWIVTAQPKPGETPAGVQAPKSEKRQGKGE